jgi:glycerol-3-phosphate dehydrogenase
MPDPTSPRRVTILGCGQMGLVCTTMLAQAEHRPADHAAEITIWGHDPDEVGELAQTRSSDRLADFSSIRASASSTGTARPCRGVI